MTAIFLALLSNLFFAVGTIQFTFFGNKISVWWINTLKVTVAALGTAVVLSLLGQWTPLSLTSIGFLATSGILGLAIGDYFLLKSFLVLGPGRTLILFGLHPLIVGFFDFYLFKVSPPLSSWVGVAIMMTCLFIFIHERAKQSGRWDLKYFAIALLAITLDAIGVVLSKSAFKADIHLTSWQANFYRSIFGSGFLIIWGSFIGQSLLKGAKILTTQEKMKAVWVSTYGTFLSLSFYLMAISLNGPLTSISAITITGPIVASTLECINAKKAPTRHLVAALLLFPFGIYFLSLRP